jgi:2-amino-4-hydroxy-6-hydroxymethyldihydropteridine diphosphokinase
MEREPRHDAESPQPATVYIALGGNLGDRAANVRAATRRMAGTLRVQRLSPLYETEPVGYTDQPAFLNTVLRGTTDLQPLDLLRALQTIERDLGRTRPFPHAPRTIDLDILFYDDLILDTPRLTIPHPDLHERFFVLVPLADLAPDLMHPKLGKTVRELLEELGPPVGIEPYLGS